MYAAGMKEKKNEQRGERPLAAKSERGSITGDPWWQVQSSKKKGIKQKLPVGWRAITGAIIWHLWELSTESRSSTTWNLDTLVMLEIITR